MGSEPRIDVGYYIHDSPQYGAAQTDGDGQPDHPCGYASAVRKLVVLVTQMSQLFFPGFVTRRLNSLSFRALFSFRLRLFGTSVPIWHTMLKLFGEQTLLGGFLSGSLNVGQCGATIGARLDVELSGGEVGTAMVTVHRRASVKYRPVGVKQRRC